MFGIALLASTVRSHASSGMAMAYIDPLSGSVFLQMLAAGLLGALFVAKSSLARFKGFVRGLLLKIVRR